MKFGLVGSMNTLIDITLFFLLSLAGILYPLAQTISYSGGVLNSYFFNRKWTFQQKERKNRREFIRFVIVNLGTLCFSILLLKLAYEYINLSLVMAKAFATLGALIFNFVLTDKWVFLNQKRRG
ncbi:GtrA family protein [Gracilibacillus halophilus]|nr:GtrA family protein [Gracilibacillus halophilus]